MTWSGPQKCLQLSLMPKNSRLLTIGIEDVLYCVKMMKIILKMCINARRYSLQVEFPRTLAFPFREKLFSSFINIENV